MNQQSWKSTGRIDGDGDPVFSSPDGVLWAISRRVGTVETIGARLQEGPRIPWSDMERVGHVNDWTLSIRPSLAAERETAERGAPAEWKDLVNRVSTQLEPLGEDVFSHDWDHEADYLLRTRLDKKRALELEQHLGGLDDLEVSVNPILSHMNREDG